MSNLANILAPTGGNRPLANHDASELANQNSGDSDFDDVMSQAMAPRPNVQNNAAPPPVRPRVFTPLPNQRKSEADPASEEADTTPAVSTMTGLVSSSPTHKSETADKDIKNADASPAPADPDNSFQNISIQFPAPTLTTLLSPSFAPAPLTGGSTGTPMNLTDWTGATGKDLALTGAAPRTAGGNSSTKSDANETATANETGKKIAAALKDLGLSPAASAKDAAAETAANADKIAGANLTAAKNDLPAPDAKNGVNTGILTKVGAQAALISTGTTVAEDEMPMKKADSTNQAAGLSEKSLPGQNDSAACTSNLLRAGSVSASTNDLPAATNIIPLSQALDRNMNATGNIDAATVVNLSDIQARAMERTHDMVTNNAMRLASTQSDTMQVVLKPGAGIELSLELRQRGGVIEAQAVLQHGDYQNLSQHWPDLQQRLDQKGIKLGALASDESSLPFNGNQGNSKNEESSEHEALFASAFAEFSLAGVLHAASAAPIAHMVRNGFETWA